MVKGNEGEASMFERSYNFCNIMLARITSESLRQSSSFQLSAINVETCALGRAEAVAILIGNE